jgi:hypothetical protein
VDPDHLSPVCLKKLEKLVAGIFDESSVPYGTDNLRSVIGEYKQKNMGKLLEVIWDPKTWIVGEEMRENLRKFFLFVLTSPPL